MLPDDLGNLWISINNCISKLIVGNETFINYDLLDGLQSNEFNAGAYFRSQRTRANIRQAIDLEEVRLQQKEQFQKTVAADFHAELGQKLTCILLLREILKTRRARGRPENADHINKIIRAAMELASSTQDFIWRSNPLPDSLCDGAIYLEDFGDEMFDKSDVQFRLSGISKGLEQIERPLEWRRHLILIFKEAMNNALKHACCENVNF